MSYLTLKVEIDHGKIMAQEGGTLPDHAHGFLMLLPDTVSKPRLTQLEAFEKLQSSLKLDENKAKKWIDQIKDARR
jgi:hypothetical protein